MDFDLPPEAEEHRARVRSFLAEHAPDGQFPVDWCARLAEAGLRRAALARAVGARRDAGRSSS